MNGIGISANVRLGPPPRDDDRPWSSIEARPAVYVGLDVHRLRMQLAVVDEDGDEVVQPEDPERRRELGEVLVSFEPGTPVVFEGMYGWSGWRSCCTRWGSTAPGPPPGGNPRRSPRRGSRTTSTLARWPSCCGSTFGEAWISPASGPGVAAVTARLAALLRLPTTLNARVRAVLANSGTEDVEALWDGPGRRLLEKLELPNVEREIVGDVCALLPVVQTGARTTSSVARPLPLDRDPALMGDA